MPRKELNGFDERKLTKGQARKLNGLRKSLGDDIANKAFAEWLVTTANGGAPDADRNAGIIADVLSKLANSGKLKIPRGGYILRRGKGRFVVERNVAEE